ncbi:acetylxylan esterase [bacterium]|jgi:cephalosporin-C deacetylase|nr:acetylxylan esterase [Planctomicrobium sp.]MDA7504151.1 acetylxylan esterase [bacterium]
MLNQSYSRPLTFTILLLSGTLLAAEESYSLNVQAEKKDAVYQIGEEAKFVVTLAQGEKPVTGKVSYVVDDFVSEHRDQFPHGTLDLASGNVIPVKLTSPSFIMCRVTFQTPQNKKISTAVGIGVSPAEIPLSLPVPDDFDQFWSQQKKQLAQVPADAKLTHVEHNDDSIQCFDVQVDCLGGAPVSGYLSKPADAAAKSLPAILWVHGAGVRSSSLPNAIKGAKANMLSMDINAHGLPNGKPGQFYKEQSAGPLKDYRYDGRENREKSYFRGMYLRLVRAIDFLTAQPEWDGKTVIVIGHSQGGGQALVAGGIDERVTFIATGVPAICDHSGRSADRINGWPKLVPQAEDGKPDSKILEASRYVDAVNFASRCKANAIMSVGFIDTVCPPSSCYAAYNQLQEEKQIINEPSMGHAAPAHIQEAFFEAVQEHVRRQNSSD